MRAVPTASTVTLATWLSLSFATSASPTVPWSAYELTFARSMKPFVPPVTFSPIWLLICATIEVTGALRTALSRSFCAFSSEAWAERTDAYEAAMS